MGFVISGAIKKIQVYQQFDVDIVPPVYNFIKSETSTQLFSCGFCKFFSTSIFLGNLSTFATGNYIKNDAEILVQVFSCKFCKFFQPVTLLKMRLQHRRIFLNFEKFFGFQLYQERISGIGAFLCFLTNF